jgi:acyl-CoA thioesterase FadM
MVPARPFCDNMRRRFGMVRGWDPGTVCFFAPTFMRGWRFLFFLGIMAGIAVPIRPVDLDFENPMNLVFRLLKILMLCWLRPGRIGILDESVVRFRVWPNDLDTNLHMNNGRYMTLMDLGRLDLLMRNGSVKYVLKQRWYPVLAGTLIRFRRPLNLFQRFEIRTRIVTWDAKWVYLEQRMLRRGDVVLQAWLKGVFMGPKGSVPITELLKLMGLDAPPPPMPAGLAAWMDAEAKLIRADHPAHPHA